MKHGDGYQGWAEYAPFDKIIVTAAPTDIPEKLGLKQSTYYAIKRRLSQHGYDFDGDTKILFPFKKQSDQVIFSSYISGLTDMTWSEANRHFEKEIIEYLFKQVGYQKLTLWTNSVLHAARHIYDKLGFSLVHEEPHHSFGHDLIAETLELML